VGRFVADVQADRDGPDPTVLLLTTSTATLD
jgi:hypothetical protein